MPIKKVKKQKQKQKQQQSVVVNVNTGRRATRRGTPRKARSGGGGTSIIPYPVYTNAPGDYAPIIHNLPAQYQNQPALSMPVQALANIPTAVAVEAVPPTQLQTNNEDERPLVSAVRPKKPVPASVIGSSAITNQFISQVKTPNRGLRPTSVRVPPTPSPTPFQEA